MGKTDAQVLLYHLLKTRQESLSWCDPVTHGACTNGGTKVFIAKVTREMENACMTQALLVVVPKDSVQEKKNLWFSRDFSSLFEAGQCCRSVPSCASGEFLPQGIGSPAQGEGALCPSQPQREGQSSLARGVGEVSSRYRAGCNHGCF